MAAATFDDDGEPTAERLRHAGRAFEVGGSKRARLRIYRMRDAPLERLYCDGRISAAQFAATQKYRWHWFCGSFAGVLHSVDPDRVFAVDFSRMTGLARTLREQEHRDEYRTARGVMGARATLAVEGIACAELSLELIGQSLGFRSPFRARTRAYEFFLEGADKLQVLWKI